MRVTIVAVHPTVTIVRHPDGQFELPTAWFTNPPTIGQEWELSLSHQPTEQEQLEQLNSYLVRD